MGWDFERGGLVEAAPRREGQGVGEALERVLCAPGARYAQGLALGLRGVSLAYGLGWTVEARGAAVVVEGGRAKVGSTTPRVVALMRRGESWVATAIRGKDADAGVTLAALARI